MKGDFTRFTFDPKKRYHGVFQQQGRVQLDADWNEQNQIAGYRTETGVADIVGKSGGPLPTPGFEIKTTADKKDLRIGPGHYYVDGILCELDAPETAPNAQEDLPASARIMVTSAGAVAYSSTPETGVYLAYLDVWLHHLTALERPELRESALGGPDHATREKLMAQVKFLRVGAPGANVNCLTDFPAFNAITTPALGKLNARTKPGKTPDDLCIVNPGAGYRRLENQLYRIEVHQGGTFAGNDLATNPSFKWSRDNGSVTARWEALNGNDLTVSTPGRDKVAGFASGQWIELTDDHRETASEPGLLVQITSVKGNVITINPGGQVINYAQFPKNPKIRRWDSPGAVRVRHNQEMQSDQYLTLEGEGGIEIHFAPGVYRTGDYWLIPARTSGPTTLGDIEWPRDTSPQKNPLPQFPLGIRHHYARLALVEFSNGEWKVLGDCRGKFSPLTDQLSLFMVGGDGQEATPHPTLPATLVPLGEPLRVGVSNGQPPVAGARVRFQVTKGNGGLEGNVTQLIKVTDATGIAACTWSLDSATLDQQVTATLLDAASQPRHLPVIFTGSLSRAAEVSFDPTNCPDLAGQFNVQAAIDTLCKIQHAGCATYSVGPTGDWTQVFAKLVPDEDAHICFQRGDFKAELPIASQDLGHIRISGAGAGSRIRVAKSEVALLFANCKSVTVENISLSTFEDEDLPHLKSLNGVLTVTDCPMVSIHDIAVACGAGLVSERACITVRSTLVEEGRPLEWVRVRGCELSVGHGQYGVLVTDALRVDIEGNLIRTAPLPETYTLEKQAAEPKRARKLAAQLAANGIYREALSFDNGDLRFDIGAFSVLLNSTVPHGEWIKLIEQQPPTAADKASRETVAAYAKRLVAGAVEQPQSLPSYGKQLTHLQTAIGEERFRNLPQEVSRNLLISREVEVKPFTEVEKSKRTTALVFGDRRVLFDSALAATDWQAIVAGDEAAAPRSNGELYRAVSKAAARIVADKAYRDRFAGARTWYEGLRERAALAVSRCGIVCAGRLAAKVCVEGNSIEGAAEGIRIAFSHDTASDRPADHAEEVMIRDNTLRLRVPFEFALGGHGLFVGNVRRLLVSNNLLAGDPSIDQWVSFAEGIRVWGHFGMALALRDNVVRDAETGIILRVEGVLDRPAPNWQVTGTSTDGKIDVPEFVRRRDNLPPP